MPGRRGAYSGVWVAGSTPWLVAFRLLKWGYAVPRSGLIGWAWGVLHLFLGRGCQYDMMKPSLLENGSPKVGTRGNCVGELVLSKRVWTLSTLTSALSTLAVR